MSQDLIEIFFSTVDESQTPAKIKKKIEKILNKHNTDYSSISCGKEKTARNCIVKIEAQDCYEALQECLSFVRSIPKEEEPFIKYWHDQAGEYSYMALVDQTLQGFDDLESIQSFFNANPVDSPEKRFYTAFADSPCKLFLRLMIKQKRLKDDLLKKSNQYIDSKLGQDYSNLNLLINSAIKKESGHECHFPFFEKLKEGELRTVSYNACELVAKSLCFSDVQGDYVYLGYNSEEIKRIFSDRHIGSDIPDLLSYMCKSISGKVDTEDLTKQNKQLRIFYIDCCNIYEADEQMHINLWPA